MEKFVEDQRSSLSSVTVSNYRLTLNTFKDFCLQSEVRYVGDVTPQIIDSYLTDCQTKGNKSKSINTKLSHIRVFFTYLVDEEVVVKNPAKKFKKVEEEVKIDIFTEEQIESVLSYLREVKKRKKTLTAYRNYVLVGLLLETGIRISEAATMKWEDVDLIKEKLLVKYKGKENRFVQFSEDFAWELNRYIQFCTREFGALPEYVFVSGEGKSVGVSTLKRVIRNLKLAMSMEEMNISAHTFRHTFAYYYLKNGGDVFELQSILGYKRIDVIQRVGSLLRGTNELIYHIINISISFFIN